MTSSFCASLVLTLLASDDYCDAKLDRLLALHREYGLPLPPPDAVLVKCRCGGPGDPGEPFLAFTLDGRTLWPDCRWKLTSIQCVRPDPERFRGVDFLRPLELALAARQRGWKPLARAAIREWMFRYGCPDAEQTIGCGALDYWERQISEAPDTPLSVVAKYLKRVQQFSPDGPASRALLRSVDLAIVPRDSPPGSDDALIDELLGLDSRPGEAGQLDGFRQDPRYRALLRRGLDAVPALIAHLKDDRITRVRGQGCGEGPLRVKGIALDILGQLRGEPFPLEGGRGVPNENVLNERLKLIGMWLADAHKLGEEKYVVARVIGSEDDDEFRDALVWLLAEKYPDRLPDVFRTVIDTRPGQFSDAWQYAKAVAEAPVSAADKQKVLEYAARQNDLRVRVAGIEYLRPFNPKLAKEQLLLGLAKHPNSFARVAAEGTDPDEWKALALAVRGAEAAWRIVLLEAIANAESAEGRNHRLGFLAEYLTDDDVRIDTNAYAKFPRLEVRNFAAMRLAELLKIDEEPDAEWTAAQWAELREWVRAKLKDELRR